MLSEKEIARYNRHLILPGFGKEAQEKLKQAKVLVVGAGGLGCATLQYLTAAGVGEIGIIDFDTIDESNLQRQVLFTAEDVGKSKVQVAIEKLTEQNSFVIFRGFNIRLTSKNALALLDQFDVIVDGTDNFSTRYLVNDACVLLGKPLVYGSIYKFEGQVSVFNYCGENGIAGPNYRCLFPEPPSVGSIPNCSEIGVLGVLPGIIGTLQATETIKIITKIGEPLSGKLLVFDALKMNFSQMEFEKKTNCCQDISASILKFEATDYDILCGVSSVTEKIKVISIKELFAMFHSEIPFELLDVREKGELPMVEKFNGIQIPLGELMKNVHSIPREKMVIVFCKTGVRSLKAVTLLEEKFGLENLYQLEGGIVAWLNQYQDKKNV